ncbi:MAG TPA: hypothetical protein VFL17_14425 [Anaerolineae bacterium]|nr:hypothetical protein [Anaerolineae bacterium]
MKKVYFGTDAVPLGRIGLSILLGGFCAAAQSLATTVLAHITFSSDAIGGGLVVGGLLGILYAGLARSPRFNHATRTLKSILYLGGAIIAWLVFVNNLVISRFSSGTSSRVVVGFNYAAAVLAGSLIGIIWLDPAEDDKPISD